MTPAAEAPSQQKLVQTTWGQRLLRRRTIGRVAFVLSLLAGLGLSISHIPFPWGVAVGLYSLAVLVAFTRVYAGAHYPRDVIAGAILGVVWGILSVLVAPYF